MAYLVRGFFWGGGNNKKCEDKNTQLNEQIDSKYAQLITEKTFQKTILYKCCLQFLEGKQVYELMS